MSTVAHPKVRRSHPRPESVHWDARKKKVDILPTFTSVYKKELHFMTVNILTLVPSCGPNARRSAAELTAPGILREEHAFC